MAAPTFGSAGTYLAGSTSTTASVPVPAGVAADDIVVVSLYVEIANAVTIPAGSGFVEDVNSPVTPGGAQDHYLHIYWKRATGADSGTYDFTIAPTVQWRDGVAFRISGAKTSGYPFDVTTKAADPDAASGVTPAVSLTTTGSDRLIVWVGTCWNAGSWTPPAGMTERVDTANNVSVATVAQPAAGSTGSLTGTCAVAASNTAYLLAVQPASPSIDSSTPARVTGAVTDGTLAVTTGTFNPPAAVLVATAQCNARFSTGAQGTITNNGTALTWTKVGEVSFDNGGQNGYAGLFVAVLPASRVGMTVTFTATPTGAATTVNSPSIKVYVVTGANTVNPVGSKVTGTSTTNNLTTTAYTTLGATSMGIVSACDWSANTIPVSADTTADTFNNASINGLSGFRLLGAAGTAPTFNLDSGGTGAAAWNWVSVEILAASDVIPRRSHSRWPGRGPTRARFQKMDRAKDVPPTGVSGTAVVGVSAAAAAVDVVAVKVAKVTGSCSAGVYTAGAVVKVARPVSSAFAGVAALPATVKRAPVAVSAPAGLAATGRVAHGVSGTALAGVIARGVISGPAPRAVTALASVGTAAAGTVRKIVTGTGTGAAGAAAVGTTRKIAPVLGRAAAGAVARDVAVAVRAVIASAAASAVAAGTVRRIARVITAGAAGAVATGAGRKVAPVLGSSSAGIIARHSGVAARAVTALATIGATAAGTVRKIAVRTGSSTAGAISATTVRKVAVASGAGLAGAHARGIVRKIATAVGAAGAAGGSARVSVAKRVGLAAQAALGALAAALVARRSAVTARASAGALADVETTGSLTGWSRPGVYTPPVSRPGTATGAAAQPGTATAAASRGGSATGATSQSGTETSPTSREGQG